MGNNLIRIGSQLFGHEQRGHEIAEIGRDFVGDGGQLWPGIISSSELLVYLVLG